MCPSHGCAPLPQQLACATDSCSPVVMRRCVVSVAAICLQEQSLMKIIKLV